MYALAVLPRRGGSTLPRGHRLGWQPGWRWSSVDGGLAGFGQVSQHIAILLLQSASNRHCLFDETPACVALSAEAALTLHYAWEGLSFARLLAGSTPSMSTEVYQAPGWHHCPRLRRLLSSHS